MPVDLISYIVAVSISFVVFGTALFGASYIDTKF